MTRLAVCDRRTPWAFLLLLTGALGQSVNYPPPVCAVTGSTIRLPCTFTPLQSEDGGELQLNVLRVLWCKNHPICQRTTPSVVDSSSLTNLPIDPRYSYLGDKTGNCTLQIRDLKNKDQGTFRFRMEMNDGRGHFTGQAGVTVTVVGTTPLRIILSGGDGVMSEGQTVKLLCSSDCSIKQLELIWFRDGHALSESGPALQLHRLTAEDSGNYTCSMKRNPKTRSEPYQLQVEPAGTGGVMSLELLSIPVVLCVSALVVFIIIRIRASKSRNEQKPDNIYCDDFLPAESEGKSHQHEEEVSYSSIHFSRINQNQTSPVMETADTIIYSSVVTG